MISLNYLLLNRTTNAKFDTNLGETNCNTRIGCTFRPGPIHIQSSLKTLNAISLYLLKLTFCKKHVDSGKKG
jgi:hypothetical protein